jgi:DNA-binding HxlR family transcriptional regulator
MRLEPARAIARKTHNRMNLLPTKPSPCPRPQLHLRYGVSSGWSTGMWRACGVNACIVRSNVYDFAFMAVATAPTPTTALPAENFDATPVAPGASPALAAALTAIGDRWSLAVVAQLTTGPQRFNDLASALAPMARTVLSDRLRKLDDAGVITRKRYSAAPTRYAYRLTVAGSELARVCGVLADWASRHLHDGQPALTHRECGGHVMPAWRCDVCGPVPARDVADTSHA